MHLKATDLAKEAFMEALARDVKCFESFEMLVGSEMMSNEEGTFLIPRLWTETLFDQPIADLDRMGVHTRSSLPFSNGRRCRIHSNDVHCTTEKGKR